MRRESFASIFLGVSLLASQLGILPDPTEEETVISQLTRTLVGEGSPYHYLIQLSTALLLVLAANTAFADFPRMASILTRDRLLPFLIFALGPRAKAAFAVLIGVSLWCVVRSSTPLPPVRPKDYVVGYLAHAAQSTGPWRIYGAAGGPGAARRLKR